MSKLGSATLTRSDQLALLKAASDRPREALLVSLALGTGPRLAEIAGLNAGDLRFRKVCSHSHLSTYSGETSSRPMRRRQPKSSRRALSVIAITAGCFSCRSAETA
jgi:integrase